MKGVRKIRKNLVSIGRQEGEIGNTALPNRTCRSATLMMQEADV
jgi:hypothetical protein